MKEMTPLLLLAFICDLHRQLLKSFVLLPGSVSTVFSNSKQYGRDNKTLQVKTECRSLKCLGKPG